MTAAGVGSKGEHCAAFAGDQLGSSREIHRALLANRIHGAVALAGILCAEKQRVGGLITFQIENTQSLAALDGTNVMIARIDRGSAQGVFGAQSAFNDHGVVFPL